MYRVPIRDMDELRQRLVATWTEFQHSVVYDAIDQWRKRLEACIHAEGGHSEHMHVVTLLHWRSSCHTSQPVVFSAADDNTQLALLRATNV